MVNYVVSGLERSGTSMMMQLLEAGGAPMSYDASREPDFHNPKGYFELEGGKIINKLMNGSFPLSQYDNAFIKITAFGLRFLPEGNYKIVYMVRNINEVMDSMEKMSGPLDREKEKPLFEKLNEFSLKLIKDREDIEFIEMNYNEVLEDPDREIARLNDFLGGMLDARSAARAVDPSLHRNVR